MKKFLIIRFSSIGDIVLTTPVLRCLKKKFPGCEIHYLTKVAFAPIVKENPYINKVYSIEKSPKEVMSELKKENYSHIIDLHKNLRSKKVVFALNAKTSSFPKLNAEKFLMVKFKMDILPKIHIVDRYFKAVEDLGVKNDKEGLDYFIPENVVLPQRIPPAYNVLVVGAAHPTKALTEEQLIKIAKESTLPVVLLGGKKEAALGEKIAEICGANVINHCDKGNLHQSALIIKHATIVITPDTGMMHVASAFKKKIISIWGNTIPEFGMYPYLPQNPELYKIFEVKELNCRPCSKIGHRECPKGHFKCIKEIDYEGVISEMNAHSQNPLSS
ncbi:MAG: glycosyltransferase family 9 protein [Flavobacteriales bacterium]